MFDSIKPLSVEPSGAPSSINTQIKNPPDPVLVTTHGKATKSFNIYCIFTCLHKHDLRVPNTLYIHFSIPF